MNTLLVGINAKFIHSNPAIRSIRDYAKEKFSLTFNIAEFTINQRAENILAEIFLLQPEILGFSCYIWNFELVKRLVNELKKVLPDCVIFLGGPEVSYNAAEVLDKTAADIVVSGEGEMVCAKLVLALEQGSELSNVDGIAFRENHSILCTKPQKLLHMDEIPFIYTSENADLENLEHRIIYYESMRGCPFNCQYCLSGNGSATSRSVRTRTLREVYSHLDFFLEKRVRQVKFVDRTFNFDKNYALSIWKYLKEHDNGYTNFHFEIAAELLDAEILDFLPTVRRGFFQLEIGVQSTNVQTLKCIKRITKIDALREIIARLQATHNMHLHLDLIVGLPLEDYDSFSHSFDDVYALSPDQFQVGFLKLLKGSGLYANAEKYGIVCSEYAPYEVLYTRELPYVDVLRLKAIEEMVEIYYNSNRFKKIISYLISLFSSPFKMFEALSVFFKDRKLHLCAHTNMEYYTIAHDFFLSLNRGEDETFMWMAKFDLYSHEKARKLPSWLTVSAHEKYKQKIYNFYDTAQMRTNFLCEYAEFDTKQLYRQAHIEVFPFNPVDSSEGETAILWNYRCCDLLGNATAVEVLI